MFELALHHVSVPTSNLAVSTEFYETVLGLRRVPRPPFPIEGVWYAVGPLQIHLTAHAHANFRTAKSVDNDDVHFALRVEDFEAAVATLKSHGYDETFEGDHPKRLILKRTGMAGFPQVFLMDPERNVIEINRAPYNYD
ncbi:VOC family protein [Aestuariivirga sp.]|uniref:VOC family protein n=1 Tax=Aestuariivirga sp. TaxID=2650926 RepID=UPI003BAB2C2A